MLRGHRSFLRVIEMSIKLLKYGDRVSLENGDDGFGELKTYEHGIVTAVFIEVTFDNGRIRKIRVDNYYLHKGWKQDEKMK